MKNISLKHRLIIPIILLGIVALLSNVLSIINIRNVNASASNIADNYIGREKPSGADQSGFHGHPPDGLKPHLATDYDTMILLVQPDQGGRSASG